MDTKETKSDFKYFILWGSFLFPTLLIINTVLFKFLLAPKESFFFNLAAAIIVSWLLILTLYYIWAIYFYNINLGWTDKDWHDQETKVKIEGSAAEPDGNPNAEETLGLPAGTVRGTIALSVLVVGLAMMIAALGLPGRLSQNEFLVDHFEFLKTAFLMVIAFYFGSKSLEFLKDRKQVIGVPGNTPTNTPPSAGDATAAAPQQQVATPVGDVATGAKSTTDFHDPSAKDKPMRVAFYISLLVLLTASCKNDKRYLVVSKIRQAAKLATTQTTIDKVVFGTSDKRLLGIIHLNQARFVAYSTAFIKSGIDLNKVKPDDIKITDKMIQIELPHVEVINFSYPFKNFKIDDAITEDAWLNKIDIFDQENFYRLAELDIRNNLKYTGLKEATEQKTRLLLEGLLKNLGYEEIYITFKEKGELIPEVDLTEGETE